MIYRCIAPDWLSKSNPQIKKVLEGEFSEERLTELNTQGYNIYFLPNLPSEYDSTRPVYGRDIDTFRYVFIDMDLKEGKWASKEAFLNVLNTPQPTLVVDSGNGIHAYWEVSDLDASSFL